MSRSFFFASLVARDASERLWERGEQVGWRVTTNGQWYTANRALAPVPLARLRSAAALIASRAARAGWTLAPTRLYATAGGAMVVTLRFDDHSLLSNRNTAFASTLFGPTFRPPIWHTLLRVEGPGGVTESAGGPAVGAFYPGRHPQANAAIPTWLLQKPTHLTVTIDHASNPKRTQRFVLGCGPGSSKTPKQTCLRLMRERALLLAPVESDSVCGGMSDSAAIRGEVAGVPLQREFGTCYGGVTQAWEMLLGVRG